MSQFSYQFASPNSICELVFEGLLLSNSNKFDGRQVLKQISKPENTFYCSNCTRKTLEGCFTWFDKIDKMKINLKSLVLRDFCHKGMLFAVDYLTGIDKEALLN